MDWEVIKWAYFVDTILRLMLLFSKTKSLMMLIVTFAMAMGERVRVREQDWVCRKQSVSQRACSRSFCLFLRPFSTGRVSWSPLVLFPKNSSCIRHFTTPGTVNCTTHDVSKEPFVPVTVMEDQTCWHWAKKLSVELSGVLFEAGQWVLRFTNLRHKVYRPSVTSETLRVCKNFSQILTKLNTGGVRNCQI